MLMYTGTMRTKHPPDYFNALAFRAINIVDNLNPSNIANIWWSFGEVRFACKRTHCNDIDRVRPRGAMIQSCSFN